MKHWHCEQSNLLSKRLDFVSFLQNKRKKQKKRTDAMKLSHILLLTATDALDTIGAEWPCEDPLLGENSKRLNENAGFPDQGTVMYVCDPEFFGQSGSYTTIKVG